MRRSDSGSVGGDPVPTLAPTLAAPEGTALYVHLPYCVAKCTYCDFFSLGVGPGSARRGELSDVIDGILLEAERRAPHAPRTVFVGGGTPTIHDETDLARLFDGLDALTGFRSSALEVTVECNPESLDAAKARRLADLGVDRLSIGFQSLEPDVLSLFGRVHGADDSLRAYEAARASDVRRVSVDLIYAVPGQELARWERDLARVLALRPDHVSAYSLAFEEGTALTAAWTSGTLERLNEETELAFFLATRGALAAAGFEAYEISNFATAGGRCRHNENYWRNGNYVGLGPGAVSYLAPTRFGNPRSIGAWKRALDDGRCAASWEETLAPVERLGETWWLGLRTADGVRPEAARATADFDDAREDPAEAEARALERHELVRQRDGAWCLTERGLPLADRVAERFLEASAHHAGRGRAALER